MDYIYATLLLNEAGKDLNADNLKKVLQSAGASVDEARVKAVLAALEGVDIKEVISKSASVAAAPSIAKEGAGASAKPVEEKKEEEEVSDEDAAAGLGALFG